MFPAIIFLLVCLSFTPTMGLPPKKSTAVEPRVGGQGGDIIPGGISQCKAVTPFHS